MKFISVTKDLCNIWLDFKLQTATMNIENIVWRK